MTVTKLVEVKETVMNGDGTTRIITRKVPQAVTVVLPPRRWMIGVQGWHDFEGLNVDNLVDVVINGQVVPSPLRQFQVLVDGQPMVFEIEPRDVIKSVEGNPVSTSLDLYMAIQQANNPRRLEIEVINDRDGTIMSGTIRAIKIGQ